MMDNIAEVAAKARFNITPNYINQHFTNTDSSVLCYSKDVEILGSISRISLIQAPPIDSYEAFCPKNFFHANSYLLLCLCDLRSC